MILGDIVGIFFSSKPTANDIDQQHNDLQHGQLASGVVTVAKSNAIHVSFEDSFDELLTSLSDDTFYNIIKLANDVTYKRLRIVLDRIKDGSRFSSLHNALFGIGIFSTPHQTLPPQLLDKDGNISYENEGLNPSQKDAIHFALKQREIAVIHGPPGTGKTTTIVEYIKQEVKAGSKLLACAPSNVAVDNLLKKLTEAARSASRKIRVVRLGHPARIQNVLQKHSLDALIGQSDQTQLVQDVKHDIESTLAKMKKSKGGKGNVGLRNELKELRKEFREREKKAIKEILSNADVVLATLTSATPWDGPLKHLKDEHFNVTVIDECSQSLEMACWIPMLQSRKVVLAGDHKQLPPTIMSTDAAHKGLSFTLMERVIQSQEKQGENVVKMLSTQYRMNENIMKWSSNTFYQNKLIADASVNKHLLCDLPGVSKDENTTVPLILIDTTGCDMNEVETSDEISKANEGEVALVVLHIQKLVDSGVNPAEIAVITPYNLQVELIRLQIHEKYPQLEVRSVDGFQGREKEAVIISLVRSNPRREIGFLGETRRLNVAVTRARRHVALICSVETVSSDKNIKGLTDYIEKDGEVRSAMEYEHQMADNCDIKRPEGMELILTDNKPNSKTKNKSKDKGAIKKEKIGKQDTKKLDDKDDSSSARVINSNKKTEEETITKQKELRLVIESFSKDDSLIEYKFPPELNSHDRLLVHEIAEEYHMIHESIGEGKARIISLKKQNLKNIAATKATETDAKILYPVEQNKNDTFLNKKGDIVKDTNKTEKKGDQDDTTKASMKSDKSKVEIVTCSGCLREIPKQNIGLHKLRCQKSSSPSLTKEAPQEKGSKKTKSQKKDARMKDEDDIDKLLETFNKLDTICNAVKVL